MLINLKYWENNGTNDIGPVTPPYASCDTNSLHNMDNNLLVEVRGV